MQWWQERTGRERALILLATGMAGLMTVFQFVYRPLADYRASGARAYENALETYQSVREGATKAAALKAMAVKRGERGDEPVRTIITRTASDAKVKVSRLQPDGKGLTVWIDEADAQALQRWLGLLNAKYGIAAQKASISRHEDRPLVRAQLQFADGGP